MRKFLIAVLLAGAAATPAVAQEQDDHGRWHHGQQNNGDSHPQAPRGDDHAQRPQFTPAPQQQVHQPPVIVQQGRVQTYARPQFNAPPQQGHAREQVYTQERFDRTVQPGQTPQAYRYGDRRGGFGGQVQQPEQVTRQGWNGQGGNWSGQRGTWNGQNRTWTGQNGTWNGQNGYYGQRQVVQQQYRDRNGYAYNGGRTWNRDWRDDRRYDWRRYRDHHRSIFQIGVYYDPFGYGYQPFNIGFQLTPAYYGQQYWLNPAMYDLPFPPPGAQWVRYWNDALLVDMYTGQVIDVIQGFFW